MRKITGVLALAGVLALTGCQNSIDNLLYDGMLNHKEIVFAKTGGVCVESYYLEITKEDGSKSRYIDEIEGCFTKEDYMFYPDYVVEEGVIHEMTNEDIIVIKGYLMDILIEKASLAIEELTNKKE